VAIPNVLCCIRTSAFRLRGRSLRVQSLEVPGSNAPKPDGGRPIREYEGSGGLVLFRRDLDGWIDAHRSELLERIEGSSLMDEVVRTRRNQRLLWDAGWLRCGWPLSVGGFGGSAIVRSAVSEVVSINRLVHGTVFAVTEVLVPSVITASPRLAESYAKDFLNGTEGWCQGFSEPDAGSDLASLRCRAVDEGDDYWVVSGQKIWTSYAQFASKMLLLARTGTTESRHRGITAMLLDMESEGVTVRPLNAITGEEEFSETFFDDVRVPKNRLVGELNGGWGVAMSMLRSERGPIFWMLSAWVLGEFERLLDSVGVTGEDDEIVGHALASIAGLRARSWTTQHRAALDIVQIPETSIDKILMASCEQELFDMALSLLDGRVEFGDDDAARAWRAEYMYSRAATIYGGTAEIQRNIVADQLLGLRSLG